MSEKKNPLGPTGETVRANVIRLRGGKQYKQLAEELAAAGRPIPALGLRRIEAGTRRVDADDLVALAVVFGVSPLTLLLPEDGSLYTSSNLTGVPDGEVAHNVQWLWGTAQEPLKVHVDDPEQMRREVALFQNRAKPEIQPRRSVDFGSEHLDAGTRNLMRSVGFGKEDDRQGLVYDDGND